MSHAHNQEVRASNQRRLVYVCGITGSFLVIEIIGGYFAGSLALLADAGHMATDLGGLILALFAIWIAAKESTPARTYGYYRAEILAALANAIVLVGISIFILYESYERFLDPPSVDSKLMILVAIAGLGVNLLGMWLLKGGETNNLNMKGAYFELLSDALSSVGVIVAAVVVWMTGWNQADAIVSAGIGLFILPRTWSLIKEAVGVLLEGTPSDINIASLRERLVAVPGVQSVHDLHVWSLSSGINAMSAHVVVPVEGPRNLILSEIHKAVLNHFPIKHITVQVEAPGFEEEETHL